MSTFAGVKLCGWGWVLWGWDADGDRSDEDGMQMGTDAVGSG